MTIFLKLWMFLSNDDMDMKKSIKTWKKSENKKCSLAW